MRVNFGPYPSHRSKKQREIFIRVDDYDVWNMDVTLAMIIVPMLKKFQEETHGSFPSSLSHSEFDDPNQYTFDFINNDPTNTGDTYHNEWVSIIDKMIWSFEQFIYEEAFSTSAYHKSVEAGFKGSKSDHDAATQHGLDLFAKYFKMLWD